LIFKSNNSCFIPVIFLFCCSKATAQNLFANSGFEALNNCVEYKTECSPEAWFNIPASIFLVNGVIAPKPVVGHMVLIVPVGNVMANFNTPRFVYTAFCCPLIAEKKYNLSFYFTAPKIADPQLAFYFTDKEPMLSTVTGLLKTPSLVITKQNFDGDYKEWHHVQCEYTATGNEKFCTLTNFGLTSVIYEMKNAMNNSGDVLYFIDEIKIEPQIPTPICAAYEENVKKLFDYNFRHTNNIPVFAEEPETKPVIKFVTDTITIGDLLFDIGKSELKPAAKNLLDSIAEHLNKSKFLKIEISGHTDNTGNQKNNQSLSQTRAAAIENYLINKLPGAADKISSSGKGASFPVAENNTAAGRQKNRRVEIAITYFNMVK